MLNDDGDIVKAYGFITIYFAELEDVVDSLIAGCEGLLSIDDSVYKWWGISKKVEFLQEKLLQNFNHCPEYPRLEDDKKNVEDALSNTLWCTTRKNDVSHSPIWNDLRQNKILRASDRHGLTEVQSTDLYDLANKIWDTVGQIHKAGFAVVRVRLEKNSVIS